MKQKYHLSFNSPKGFTLIELLLVITIIGIMASFFLVDWTSGRVLEQLSAEAREIEAVLRQGQNYALTGSQGVSGTDPCRYQFSWSGTTYTLTYWYKNAMGNCAQSTVLSSYTLSDGVAFANSNNFYFTLPHGALSFGGASQAIVLSKISSTHTACVYASGLIATYPGSTCP